MALAWVEALATELFPDWRGTVTITVLHLGRPSEVSSPMSRAALFCHGMNGVPMSLEAAEISRAQEGARVVGGVSNLGRAAITNPRDLGPESIG
jgi:hypothetical protein